MSFERNRPSIDPDRPGIEALAQALYEASDTSTIPWARRGHMVRDPWIQVARRRIAEDKAGGGH